MNNKDGIKNIYRSPSMLCYINAKIKFRAVIGVSIVGCLRFYFLEYKAAITMYSHY